MVTILIEPIVTYTKKKNPKNHGFTMVCYFDEFLFHTWTQLFKDVHECSRYADGFLFENMIAPDQVYTIIDKYDLISNTDLKKISIKGIPYSINFKPTEKYTVED